MASRWFDFGSEGDKFRMYISQLNKQKSRFPLLFNVQVHNRDNVCYSLVEIRSLFIK